MLVNSDFKELLSIFSDKSVKDLVIGGYAVVKYAEPRYVLSQHERRTSISANDMKRTSRTNWDRLKNMTDEEIDYSDIPPLSDEFFARAKLRLPNTVELDPDILAWFKRHSRDYSSQINQVLRQHIELQEQ